jgi:thiamine monophosphate kinase
MDSTPKEIQIVLIDKDKIEKDNSFAKAYRYPFKLTSVPDPLWVELFEKTYDTVEDPQKRKMYISEDYIIVIMASDDNKQKYVDIVKCLVFETNGRYRRACREKENQDNNQLENKDDILHNLKEETDKFAI